MKIDIKDWRNDRVIYTGEADSVRDLLERGVRENVNFDYASLDYASLDYASLDYARLSNARLNNASLNNASLNYASLDYASLNNARLDYARLNYASLDYARLNNARLNNARLNNARLNNASLNNASLDYASLNNARLPAPSVFIGLVNWGEVSDELCADLMLWDAANHPDPTAFDRWAAKSNGPCPYFGDVRVNRACWFQEKRALWGKGQMCRPWDLMQRLIAEKCPPWTDEQIVAFEKMHAEARKVTP